MDDFRMNIDNSLASQTLTDAEFNKLSKFIFEEYGIKMPIEKKVMLQSRLQKRLRVLNLSTFKEYVEYVFSNHGSEEVIHMIDVVSTNKTDFFREPDHFDYMQTDLLPEFMSGHSSKKFNLWSAGSSSGEEAYTIAMVLADFKESNPSFDFSILGTDISTRILDQAREAIYREEKAEVIPLSMKKKYMLRSKDREKPTVRMRPEIRMKTSFQRLNFMDSSYPFARDFDVIFCRNVLIYFNRETQEAVINKLCSHLKSGGYLFLGHSESITNMNVPLIRIRPTIFKHQ